MNQNPEDNRLFFQRPKEAGTPPGTMEYIGEETNRPVQIDVTDITPSDVDHMANISPKKCTRFKDPDSVTWINVNGVHKPEIVRSLCEQLNIHPLLQEDIVNTTSRLKVEIQDDYIFIQLAMLQLQDNHIIKDQLSLIITESFVVSLQESGSDVFNPVRHRINTGKGTIRERGPDYIAYALIDAIVDNYFVILDHISNQIESLDKMIIDEQNDTTLQEIHDVKEELLYLRKLIMPAREIISNLEREESGLIASTTEPYLLDIRDHLLKTLDTIETYRELVKSTMDMYISTASNRMNEVMKFLTIIATIFIPLTFIAGIYGMNFEYMPELTWRYGYHAVWGVMLLVIIGQLIYFRKNNWI